MPVINTVVTLNAVSPTLLATGRGMDTVSVVVSEASANVFLGGEAVTAVTGTQLSATTDRFSADLGPGDLLFGIASAGTPTVKTMVLRQ